MIIEGGVEGKACLLPVAVMNSRDVGHVSLMRVKLQVESVLCSLRICDRGDLGAKHRSHCAAHGELKWNGSYTLGEYVCVKIYMVWTTRGKCTSQKDL